MITFERKPIPSGDAEPLREPARHAAPESALRNTDAVLGILEYRVLDFNGRTFRVPPISGLDGVRLLEIKQRMDQAGETDDVAAYARVLRDVGKLATKLLIPCGWRRYLWKLGIRRNPIREATEREIGAVVGFLFECRMNGRIRLVVDPVNPSTSPKASQSSRATSQRGRRRTVSR